MSRRHREGGGADTVQSRPVSLVDRLLRPMFSLGFSANTIHEPEPDPVLGFKSGRNVSDREGEVEEDEGENSEPGGYKNFKKSGGNPNSSSKKRENGGAKFCARGHWKPSEDAKLKELVSAYGPQNWNLIAEKLEGRSGKNFN